MKTRIVPKTLAVAAAVVAASSSILNAQVLIADLFGGSNGANPTTLTASAGLVTGDSTSGPIGPGYNGTVTLPAGVLYDLSMTINDGGDGDFSVSGSGVAGLGGTFAASKTFSTAEYDSPIQASQLYALTLTTSSSASLSLLSSFNISLTVGGAGVNNSTNSGLLGVVDLLGLFGSSDTATILFTAPSSLGSGALSVSLTGSTLAGLLGNEVTISGATIAAVPEPNVALLVGTGLFIVMGGRRFARSIKRGNA